MEKERVDKLINPSYYPVEIQNFLEAETEMLNVLQPCFNILIEVGCMHGRFLDWAVTHSKRYLGIDVVRRYIEQGQQKIAQHNLPTSHYQCRLGDAQYLPEIVSDTLKNEKLNHCLAFFPFNSFGNIPAIAPVLRALKNGNFSFFISTYQTTGDTTRIRKKYYQQCGYCGLDVKRTNKGVCFTSDEGLHTWAYHSDYIYSMARKLILPIIAIPFSDIGMAYMSAAMTLTPLFKEKLLLINPQALCGNST